MKQHTKFFTTLLTVITLSFTLPTHGATRTRAFPSWTLSPKEKIALFVGCAISVGFFTAYAISWMRNRALQNKKQTADSSAEKNSTAIQQPANNNSEYYNYTIDAYQKTINDTYTN